MGILSHTWLTDHLIDFEYKKYVVLDYVHKVGRYYQQSQLYPYFSENITHFKNLKSLKEKASSIEQEGGKNMTGFDWATMKIQYEKASSFQDDTLSEINKIIDFALPNFQTLILNGKNVYDFVEEQLSLSPVGIIPLRISEGYLLLDEEPEKDVFVYRYEISEIEHPEEKSKMLSMQSIGHYTLSVKWNYENIKHDVIRKQKDLPNPAVYAIHCKTPVPFEETFLPIAKRYFLKKMAA